MPFYPPLPELEGETSRNDIAFLLFLQRLRQSLEDVIVEVSGSILVDEALRQTEFIVASLNPAITPQGRLLEVEEAVLSLVRSPGSIRIDVDTNGIAYEKIQTVGENKLLGNVGVAGDVEEIEISSPLFFNGAVLSSTAPAVKRVVDTAESRVILDQYSLVAARYFTVLGSFTLEGDAALEVL